MILRSLILATAFGLCHFVSAQAPQTDSPRTYLKFLSPGDLVGIRSIDGTTSVVVSIYSKPQYEIAKMLVSRGRSLHSAKELAAESELAQKELKEFLSQNESVGYAEDRLMVIPLIRTSLGQVIETGIDYVLIDLDGKPQRRCVIPAMSIGKIYLDATPIRFSGPRRATESGGS